MTGRLARPVMIEQDMKLALREVELAMSATNIETARQHAALARRFIEEALTKMKRLRVPA